MFRAYAVLWAQALQSDPAASSCPGSLGGATIPIAGRSAACEGGVSLLLRSRGQPHALQEGMAEPPFLRAAERNIDSAQGRAFDKTLHFRFQVVVAPESDCCIILWTA